MTLNDLNRVLDPVRRRLANMLARAVVRVITESSKLQELQIEIEANETREACERFQQYGLSSYPIPGAEAVVLFLGGYRDHPIVTNVDDRRYRPTTLVQGEVALYTDEGDGVHLRRGRIVWITGGTKAHVETPVLEVSGNVDVGGVYKVDGLQVLSNRGAAIADVTGGSTVDGQARSTLNTLLARLRSHGIIEA